MNNKAFKEMIKKHQVKQSFILLNPDVEESIYRFYQDTSDPEKLYCSTWLIDRVTNQLQKEVKQISKEEWLKYWHAYSLDCTRTDVFALDYFQKMSVEAPMHQRKYWKIKADTVLFMKKDQRISKE